MPHNEATPQATLAELILSISRRLSVLTHPEPGVGGLSPLEAMVMRQVDAHPGISPSRLAAQVGLKSSNASTTIRELEAKGLLRRGADEGDARAVRVFPTDGAHDHLAAKRASWDCAVRPYLDDAEALDQTIALLAHLDRKLEAEVIQATTAR